MAPVLRLILILSLLAAGSRPGGAAEEPLLAAALGDPAPLNPDLLGFNEDWPGSVLPLGDPILPAVRAMGFTTNRFPGGSISNFWDWEAGRIVPAEDCARVGPGNLHGRYIAMRDRLADRPAEAYRVEAAARSFAAAGIGVQWVTNAVTRDAASDAAMISAVAMAGGAVRYVELGNELHFGFHQRLYRSGEAYVRAQEPVIAAVRTRLPQALIGVCASTDGVFDATGIRSDELVEPGGGRTQTYGERWNQGLLQARDRYDGWIVHAYHLKPELLSAHPPAAWPSLFLALPGASLANGADFSRAHGVPLWLTEYGIGYQKLRRAIEEAGEQRRPFTPSEADRFYAATRSGPLHALCAAAYVLAAMEANDAYRVMDYHSLSGMEGFGMLRPAAGSADRVLVNGVAQVFSHLLSLSRGARTMAPIAFPGGPTLDLVLAGRNGLPALQGIAFAGDRGTTLAILNRGRDDLRLAPPDGAAVRTLVYRGGEPPADLPFPTAKEWTRNEPYWRSMALADLAAPHPWAGPLPVEAAGTRPGEAVVLPGLSLTIVAPL